MNDQALLVDNATAPRHQGGEFIDEHQALIMLVRHKAVTSGSGELAWLKARSASNSGRSPNEPSHALKAFWGIEDGSFPDIESFARAESPFYFESHAYTDWMQGSRQHFSCVLDDDSKTARSASDSAIPSCNQGRSLVGFIDAQRLSHSIPVPHDMVSHNESRLHSTVVVDTDRWMNGLDRLLDRSFVTAHEEQFEAGMESRLSKELRHLCNYRPTELLRALRSRLIEGDTSPDVLAEVLEWASREERISLRSDIVDLLTLGLYSRSPLVRDAAALGLAYFDGSASIRQLRRAIEREKLPELRADMEELAYSLET